MQELSEISHIVWLKVEKKCKNGENAAESKNEQKRAWLGAKQ